MEFSTNCLKYRVQQYFLKHDKSIVLFSIIVIAISLLRIGYTYNCYGVSSEGWYTMYASLILDGKVPYKDFDLLFPPLYAYIIAFVQLIFGPNLIVCRVLGVIIFVAVCYVAYRIFCLLFPAWISAISAVIVMVVLQSDNTFISYDYIQFYNLFNYISLYFLLRTIVEKYENPEYCEYHTIFFAGIFLALSILIRQPSGIIMLIYCLIFLIILYLFVKKLAISLKSLMFFLLGVAIPLVVLGFWILLSGVGFTTFLEMTIFSGSKGSLSTMLFKWITLLVDIPFKPVICVLVVCCLCKLYPDNAYEHKQIDSLVSVISLVFFSLLIILFYSPYLSTKVFVEKWTPLEELMFFINLSIILFLVFVVVTKPLLHTEFSKKEAALLFLTLALFMLQFGSGTSGGLSLGQGALNFGLVVALALNCCKKIPVNVARYSCKIAVLIFVGLLFATSIAVRVDHPYEWWGMNVEPYSDTTYTTDLDYFHGIKINEHEKEVYESFVQITQQYLGENDDLYCYSQVALFYTLAHKLPKVKAPIAWFDVSRNSTILEDLNYLQSNLPKMILFADHGEYVLKVHEDLFGTGNDAYAHRWLYEWLVDCKNGTNGEYVILKEYYLDNYTMYLLLRC